MSPFTLLGLAYLLNNNQLSQQQENQVGFGLLSQLSNLLNIKTLGNGVLDLPGLVNNKGNVDFSKDTVIANLKDQIVKEVLAELAKNEEPIKAE